MRAYKLSLALAMITTSVGAAAIADAAPTRRLSVTSNPPGATLYLDDIKSAPLGVTPLRRVRVPYGFHNFIFVKEGYRTETVGVEIGRRSRRVKAELLQLARLQATAGHRQADGAMLVIDGSEVGRLPYNAYITPGRHQLQVSKEGYETFEQWFNLSAGQVLSLPVLLSKKAEVTATLFVTSDISQATVKIDGEIRGRTPVSIEVRPGPMLVEVSAQGLPTWRKKITVKPQEKSILEAQLQPDSGPTGKLLVLSSVPGTVVSIDGTKTGTAPVTIEQLSIGSHLVEATAAGYEAAQAVVEVAASKQSVIKLELKPMVEAFGQMSIRATVPGAMVFVDGGQQGPAPVELSGVRLGPHSVVVRAEGHEDFKTICEVKRNQVCNVVASLKGIVRISVSSTTPLASLTIDSETLGPLPYEGEITVGAHLFKVSAPGYHTYEQSINIKASTEMRSLQMDLESAGLSDQEVQEQAEAKKEKALTRAQGATSYTGLPVAKGNNSMDISVSMPYILDVRGTVGIIDDLAVGIGLKILERNRSFAASELSVKGHTGFRPVDAFSLGVQLEGSAGTNFDTINTVSGSLVGLATLHFSNRGAFTLSVIGEVLHDTWGTDPTISVTETEQSLARLRAGATVNYWTSDSTALFGGLEYRLAGDDRALLKENYFGAVDTDPRLYARVGITLNF